MGFRARGLARHKNDQAWVEQKNGSVVRRLVGYRRLEGLAAAAALSRLYPASRLFVNFFQPSFKLASKTRVGAKVHKTYHAPETPYAKLLASAAVDRRDEGSSARRRGPTRPAPSPGGDPIRATPLGRPGRRADHARARAEGNLDAFLAGLATAWQHGEVRATHRRTPRPARDWRTRKDPFERAWPCVRAWLEAEPDCIGRELFVRLQDELPGVFPDNQLRTFQRRVREWRQAAARQLIFAPPSEDAA